MKWKNLTVWCIALPSGAIVGIMMIPIEIIVTIVARLLGAKNVHFHEVGFVFRQFTDLRVLRDQWPLNIDKDNNS